MKTHAWLFRCAFLISFLICSEAFALDQAEYDKLSIDGLTKIAALGDVDAMYNLGLRYGYGAGVAPKIQVKAIAWFLKAAEKGHKDAMFELGNAYRTGTTIRGLGLDRDGTRSTHVEAYKWLSLAATAEDGGIPNNKAQNSLSGLRRELTDKELVKAEQLVQDALAKIKVLNAQRVAEMRDPVLAAKNRAEQSAQHTAQQMQQLQRTQQQMDMEAWRQKNQMEEIARKQREMETQNFLHRNR